MVIAESCDHLVLQPPAITRKYWWSNSSSMVAANNNSVPSRRNTDNSHCRHIADTETSYNTFDHRFVSQTPSPGSQSHHTSTPFVSSWPRTTAYRSVLQCKTESPLFQSDSSLGESPPSSQFPVEPPSLTAWRSASSSCCESGGTPECCWSRCACPREKCESRTRIARCDGGSWSDELWWGCPCRRKAHRKRWRWSCGGGRRWGRTSGTSWSSGWRPRWKRTSRRGGRWNLSSKRHRKRLRISAFRDTDGFVSNPASSPIRILNKTSFHKPLHTTFVHGKQFTTPPSTKIILPWSSNEAWNSRFLMSTVTINSMRAPTDQFKFLSYSLHLILSRIKIV